ncbi:hypothetical protein [Actinoplanes siamensis]|uniref:LPXTG-motif cell wall-anchored protein n=1 Tax=Actinoplanes siamensis TaxID=1223317 RepID=A0A919N7V1_9ACTN|nr:hypothetical protein [Actinoplanes siamensis]GIF05926.1 hypothetical protein Asi03nite_34640 [Actinoplanes siamensis]
MSLARRLAVGLPVAGAAAFAALAVSSPVLGATDPVRAGHPVVMASPDRGHAGYGPGGAAPATPATTAPATTAPPAGAAPVTETPGTVGGARGNAGYGSISPAGSPTVTGGAKSVPGRVSSASVPQPGGVSNERLPLTGGPVGATVAVGAVLVAGGAGALWYTRRRKTA